MAWKVTCVKEERFRFIDEYREESLSLAELCRCYGVSRKTGYKWIGRYEEGGLEALSDQSRAPRHHPNQVSGPVQQRILDLRAAHPSWGPKKLHAWLCRREPNQAWPAVSSIGAMLKREGLSWARRKRRHASPSPQPLSSAVAPNQLWCADYKRWFICGDRQRCHRLTIAEAHSRYLLRCQGMRQTKSSGARGVFEAAFREYGLAQAMRTDNGAPFASVGLQGLSRLSVWWLKLGIRLERIEPGEPQQNGSHERMHRTLKAEATQPAAANLRAQQAVFDQFRREFNENRPHEALGFLTPAECYEASGRRFPDRLEPMRYGAGMETRLVSINGEIHFDYSRLFVSGALAGEQVGLEPIRDGVWRLWFGELCLGDVDERSDWGQGRDRSAHWLKLQSPYGLLPPEPTSAEEGSGDNKVLPMCLD